MILDADFWQNRYQTGETGWDMGSISTPLKEYFDQLTNTSTRILIPGCGRAYEAEYLHRKGFTQVVVADFAPMALEAFASRVPDFPQEHLVCGDFFSMEGQYDLIVEQTFLSAINPTDRTRYANQMYSLLAPSGTLMGVLFNDFENNTEPPFGGSEEEFRALFEPIFDRVKIAPCYNSIEPRKGRELFIICHKKKKNS